MPSSPGMPRDQTHYRGASGAPNLPGSESGPLVESVPPAERGARNASTSTSTQSLQAEPIDQRFGTVTVTVAVLSA